MSENNKKKITADELLSKLGKKGAPAPAKDERESASHPHESGVSFKNTVLPEDTAPEDTNADDGLYIKPAADLYKKVEPVSDLYSTFGEYDPDEPSEFAPMDADESESIGEPPAEPEEAHAENETDTYEAPADEYAPDEYAPDEYSADEYAPDGYSADEADNGVYAPADEAESPVDNSAFDEAFSEANNDEYSEFSDEVDNSDIPAENSGDENPDSDEAFNDEYDDSTAEAEATEAPPAEIRISADEILPDDDFFDNDPIDPEDDEEDTSADEEPVGEEYNEEKDFEDLVAEVTGDPAANTDLDETDISLMVALGMEDELAKSVGVETAAQMTDDYVADQEEWVDKTKRYGAGEYSDPAENGEIAEKYKKRNTFALVGMLANLVLALLLLVYENLPVVGYQLSGFLDPAVYPVVYVMVDLQLVIFMAAFACRSVFGGLRDIFKLKLSVDCFPAIMTVAAIVCSIISAYSSVPGSEPMMLNFPTALCLLFAAIGEYLTVRREIFSFNIVSSKKPKFVMRRLSTRDSVMETQAVANMDDTADDNGDIIKIQKTDFVDGYFWRTKNRSTVHRSLIGLIVVLSLVLAVVIGVYAGLSHLKEGAVAAGFAALSAVMPASMVVIGCYPFYRANRNAYEKDSTIIGEGSVEEYSGVGVISFDDINVFPSYGVKVRNVRLFNNCRIDKVLYYAASVFSATGGPLADVFEVATMETGHSDNVEILETGSGYIEATVNGKSIMFGRAATLSKLGIIIPEDVVNENTDLAPECSVMYMIYQRKLVAKMIVNYVIDPDFEYILKQLTGSGMCVCVKTFDPNIDEEMIYRQVRSGKYAMRVIKYRNTEEITKYAKRSDGGIVSRGNTKSLLHTVSSCDKILSAQKTGFVIGAIAAIISAVVMGVVLLSGKFDSMHSVYLALNQLFWLLPVLVTTNVIVR